MAVELIPDRYIQPCKLKQPVNGYPSAKVTLIWSRLLADPTTTPFYEIDYVYMFNDSIKAVLILVVLSISYPVNCIGVVIYVVGIMTNSPVYLNNIVYLPLSDLSVFPV